MGHLTAEQPEISLGTWERRKNYSRMLPGGQRCDTKPVIMLLSLLGVLQSSPYQLMDNVVHNLFQQVAKTQTKKNNFKVRKSNSSIVSADL